MTSVVKDGACDIYRMVVKPGVPLIGKSHAAVRGVPVHLVQAGGDEPDVQGDLRRRGGDDGEGDRQVLQVHREDHRRAEHADDGADDHPGEAREPVLREPRPGERPVPEARHRGRRLLPETPRLGGAQVREAAREAAAAAIYLCSQIYEPAARAEGPEGPAGDPEGDPALAVDLRRISEVSGMAEGTIRTSYEDMYPYAARMFPEAYRDKVDSSSRPRGITPRWRDSGTRISRGSCSRRYRDENDAEEAVSCRNAVRRRGRGGARAEERRDGRCAGIIRCIR